ncbi:hypothetical protein [Nocardia aurantiaca]|uniref:Uncharacterized protein n=1 Tax=Nocardia aurantiaca TaxID=2675850 RepID=A0A6I3L532_9NOCA|nr:hypothetical protein [Nocardia aurantiaca]MTE17462.1 hypothetical protein [Nocardia aurantiaca]
MNLLALTSVGTAAAAVVGAYVAVRKHHNESRALGSRHARRLRARIEALDADVKLLDPHCPSALVQDLARAKRALAARHAVMPDDAEVRVAVTSMLNGFCCLLLGYGVVLFDERNWFTAAVALMSPCLALVMMLPALHANRRFVGRRIFYERLGDRDDLPVLPSANAWPFLSRTPSTLRMHTWVTACLASVNRDPDAITATEIEALQAKIDRWYVNPWWRLPHRITGWIEEAMDRVS